MTVDASGLEGARHLLERSGTAERVAAILRQYITDGVFAPGERLSEPVISSALGGDVSACLYSRFMAFHLKAPS